jgi:hypothetical protein
VVIKVQFEIQPTIRKNEIRMLARPLTAGEIQFITSIRKVGPIQRVDIADRINAAAFAQIRRWVVSSSRHRSGFQRFRPHAWTQPPGYLNL